MNPNYNQTITLYNCLRAKDNSDSTKDVWYRTVLENCYYKCALKRSDYRSDKNPRMDSAYTVRIPESPAYKPYREWVKLSDAERKQFFTCSEKDIVIAGEYKQDITGEQPNTASQILNLCKPDAFVVTAISDNTHRMCSKHYRLGG